MPAKPTVLLAMRPQAVVPVQRAIGQYAELVAASRYEDALAKLSSRDFDLVVCGIYFEETRMFDLVRAVKRDYPSVPIICCRLGDSAIPPITLEATGIAAKSMGAAGFYDLPILRGDPALDREFRSVVLAHARRRG
jgi:DNA-binding NtrC family response regulator